MPSRTSFLAVACLVAGASLLSCQVGLPGQSAVEHHVGGAESAQGELVVQVRVGAIAKSSPSSRK